MADQKKVLNDDEIENIKEYDLESREKIAYREEVEILTTKFGDFEFSNSYVIFNWSFSFSSSYTHRFLSLSY